MQLFYILLIQARSISLLNLTPNINNYMVDAIFFFYKLVLIVLARIFKEKNVNNKVKTCCDLKN